VINLTPYAAFNHVYLYKVIYQLCKRGEIVVRRYVALAASMVIAGGLLAACGNTAGNADSNQSKAAGEHQHIVASGDLQEATASKEILPSFLNGASEKLVLAYQVAALLPEELQQIPCYCGCGESAGHKSNFNCFIATIEEDEIVWDDHGTRCGICVDTALSTANLLKEGRSPSEIRDIIDEMYGEGFGEPTPLS